MACWSAVLRSFTSGAGPRLAAIGILAGMGGWLATASLQQDFAAYYTAGAAAGRGLDPYVNHLPTPGGPWDGIAAYRHSRFLYPPLVAEFFRPFAALPFAWAKAIFTAASVAALLLGLALVTRTIVPPGDRGRGTWAAWTPLLCAIWPPVFLTLERGQIDLLLFAALAAAWHWRGRLLIAAPLLAVAVMGKPLILGVLPLLIAGRRSRLVAATLGALVVLGAANVALSGRVLSGKYLRDVLPRAANHGEGGPQEWLLSPVEMARAGDDLDDGVARIDGAGRVYPQEIGTFRRNASLPRLLVPDTAPPGVLRAAVFATFLILGAVVLVGAWRSPNVAAWYWGASVAAVVAAPVSWAMSLVWALPLFCLGLAGAGPRDGSSSRAFFVLLLVTFAAGLFGPLRSTGWVLAGLAAVAAAATATIKRQAPA